MCSSSSFPLMNYNKECIEYQYNIYTALLYLLEPLVLINYEFCHIYKIINNLCHFPSNVISLSTNRSHKSHSLQLNQPFARTNSYYCSFLLHTILHWNSLPSPVVCATSIREFKGLLRCILYYNN